MYYSCKCLQLFENGNLKYAIAVYKIRVYFLLETKIWYLCYIVIRNKMSAKLIQSKVTSQNQMFHTTLTIK